MTSPIMQLSDLVIGTVESVSPSEVRVFLEIDAPQNTALNTGVPSSFPRINSYVLIPNEAGATVCYITWIGIERSPYPKRSGLKDFGLIDLPFPLRKMSVSPVGTLVKELEGNKFSLSRGVIAFPSVGDQVLIPTSEQIEAIVGSRDSDKKIKIGTSPMSSGAEIMVDPDKLFGRHLAVLGNTGSGKSCSVAGLIRWSLEASESKRQSSGRTPISNARFIVLDPNGEYARAFQDMGDKVRLFSVAPNNGQTPLEVPAWMWSGREWSSIAHAQPGAQRPLLFQGLRELRSGVREDIPRESLIRRYLHSYVVCISSYLVQGVQSWTATVPLKMTMGQLMDNIVNDCNQFINQAQNEDVVEALRLSHATISPIVDSRRSGQYFNSFSVADLESVRDALNRPLQLIPDLVINTAVSEDSPIAFDVNLLADHLERIALNQGGNLAGFISTLGLRIKGMLADPRLSSVIAEPEITLEAWLQNYIGGNNGENGNIAVIDLSLVPSEIIHIVVAVLSRLVFESAQRYRRLHPEGRSLPTVLALEEAHTFVKRSRDDDSGTVSSSQLCKEIFEKIAREGRKFGLGLLLSSQRPSELSPTVLAQCNTFLLHRLVNDVDQELVSKLVPDNVGGLLKELPSLPSKQAILLGWATPIPVLVEVNELPRNQQPQSDDPDYWDVWTGESERNIDWGNIANDWIGRR